MPYKQRDFNASSVQFGAFTLGLEQITLLSDFDNYSLDETSASALKIPGKSSSGMLYLGDTPSTPAVGDLRVQFSSIPNGPVSIIARQQGSGFTAYQTKVGKTIQLVERGAVSSEAMFEQAQQENTMIMWFLRGFGWLLMRAAEMRTGAGCLRRCARA